MSQLVSSSFLGLNLQHFPVRRLSADDPGRWLAAGWKDFRRAPTLSLLYGGGLVLIGYLVVLALLALEMESLLPVTTAGFFLIAPILAIGLYDVSRRHQTGEPASLMLALTAWQRNPPGIATMGLVLMLSVAAWMQIAILIFMGFYHSAPPPMDDFIHGVLMSPQLIPFLLVGSATGYVLGSFVFALSAISIPMLLDRDIAVGTAICTSIAAVQKNWDVMFAWAATIVFLVAMGMATMFVGLVITLPLVAYGSWHAYRASVE
ncbi:MAG TPA: DUF2189 domain-containing protein [Rhodospirillaceae bacterium]|nr:DUF2189 domain-containing protein [Rhodospirillaceae bacterium]